MKWAGVAILLVAALIVIAGAIAIVRMLLPRRELPPCGTTLRNPKGSKMDERRVAMLALGAPLSAHWRAFIDSLETGYNVKDLRNMLRDAWGVRDAASFDFHAQALLGSGGHRAELDLVCGIYRSHPLEDWPHAATMVDIDEPRAVVKQLERLHQNVVKLEAAGIGGRGDLSRSVAAWDFSRVVSLARAAHDCGYITPEVAWRAIEAAYAGAREHNHSWREFAASYLIGRALWGGDESLDHFIDVSSRMLNDPENPWSHAPWV